MNTRQNSHFTSLTVRMSLGTAALLALAACSGGGTDAAAPNTEPTSASPSAGSPTDQPSAEPSSSAATPSTGGDSSAAPTVPPSTAPSSTTLAPTPSATPTAPSTAPSTKKPRLIGYAGGESTGVEVHTRSDAKKLHGAPASFKTFIGDIAQKFTDTSDCDAAAKGVTVETLRTDGFAAGGVNDCGGYAALWAVVDGRWKQIQGSQDAWKCDVLKRYQVPSDVAGTTCYDYQAQQAHTYHQK